jgi:hypothetical protein
MHLQKREAISTNERKPRGKGRTRKELRQRTAVSARPTPTHVCKREGIVVHLRERGEAHQQEREKNPRKTNLTESQPDNQDNLDESSPSSGVCDKTEAARGAARGANEGEGRPTEEALFVASK